jgi:hypothetical protein
MDSNSGSLGTKANVKGSGRGRPLHTNPLSYFRY